MAEDQRAASLRRKVAERTRELEGEHVDTLQRLALSAEDRGDDTSRHTERVGATAAQIGAQLGMDREQVELLRDAAALHDVGKLAIPDAILLKPGSLSEEEFEVMKTHAAIGQRLLSASSSPVLQMAAVIAGGHHERWDGSGYPAGLAGEGIPLVGRIVAVADVYDALTHDRPYKSLWPTEQAIGEIRRAAGGQFDPGVVDAFLQTRADVRETPVPALWPQRPPRTRAPKRSVGWPSRPLSRVDSVRRLK
jgi:putative two-component system response regulator